MFVPTPRTDASDLRIAIVASRYHEEITRALAAGARRTFLESGGLEEDLLELSAPGTFELPVICSALAHGEQFDAIVALGCVVTGETRHDEYIANAVAKGLMDVSLETGVPVAFGVLTVANLEQARARAGIADGARPAGAAARTNKGSEAMTAAIDAVLAIGLAVSGLDAPEDEDDR